MNAPTDCQHGFSLVELAVVLMIVGLLLGGLLLPMSAQRDSEALRNTEKALAEIREALIGYAIINGRLPCPAEPAIASGAANAGSEATTGTGAALTCACASGTSQVAAIGATACTTAGVAGVLPWATLGLPETDVWNNRYSYRVNQTFSRGVNASPTTSSTFGTGCALTQVSDMPTKSAFALCTQGDITVLVASGGTAVATQVPAVVVAHGKSGLGAWTTSGSQLAGAAGDELENANGDATFISNTVIDDRLSWVPTSMLMNRMLAAAKLP